VAKVDSLTGSLETGFNNFKFVRGLTQVAGTPGWKAAIFFVLQRENALFY